MYRCRIQNRDPPQRSVTLRMLAPNEQRLIEMADELRFGTILRIPVRNGQLQLNGGVKVKRTHRLDREDGASRRKLTGDSQLRGHQLRLIEKIRSIKSGSVTIEVGDGLPMKLTIDEIIGIQAS